MEATPDAQGANTTSRRLLIWLFLFLRHQSPQHATELERRVTRRVMKNAPLHRARPDTNTSHPAGARSLASCPRSVSQKCQERMLSGQQGLSLDSLPSRPSFRRTGVCLAPSPRPSPPHREMSGTRRLARSLVEPHFPQGCDNRFQLDLPSLGM